MDDLTEDEIAALTGIAGLIIPASAEYGVPGADDPTIMQGVIAGAARDPDSVRAALEAFAEAASPDAFRQAHPGHASRLQALVAFAYYRDPRVLKSLGAETRPPFPRGYEVEKGSFDGLEKVKARGPIWRKVDQR